MRCKASSCFTPWEEARGLVWALCYFRNSEKLCPSLPTRLDPSYEYIQEFPDRMLATFSILPSPKVSTAFPQIGIWLTVLARFRKLWWRLVVDAVVQNLRSLLLALQCALVGASTGRE